MARVLSRTLTLVQNQTQTLAHKALVPSSLLLRRAQSSRSGKNEGEITEIDISSNPSDEDQASSASDLDTNLNSRLILMGIRRIDDAIQAIIIKRSAPDWLPFVPGASYWVPPAKKSVGLLELVTSVASEGGELIMTEEECLSFTSVRGYPSSTYYLEGMQDLI